MTCDLEKVSRFFEVAAVLNDLHPSVFEFRLPLETGSLVVEIDTLRSLVDLVIYDRSDKQLFASIFACDRIEVDDSPPPRKIARNVTFYLTAAPFESAVCTVGKPPGYSVELLYMDLKNVEPSASPEPPPSVSGSGMRD